MSSLLSLLLLSSCILFTSLVHCSNNGGFTVDLFHRESINSPSHDPTKTPFERLKSSIDRSLSRKSSLTSSLSDPQLTFGAPIIAAGGEYLMRISVGTPPVEQMGILDTGSDLTWIQCRPCQDCYPQKLPIFDPTGSSSYRPVSCESDRCRVRVVASYETSCGRNSSCLYEVNYADGSQSSGDLAAETLTFQGNVSFPRVAFGCGHVNRDNFNETGSGLVGLGDGPVSIINQLESTIGGKFSYCLTLLNSNVSSKISFGSAAVVGGDGAVTTPLVKKSPVTFYYLTLEGISVGDERIASTAAESEGNIIIDSGTTLTFVPQEIYKGVEAALVKAVRAERVSYPQGTFGLCYGVGRGGKVEAPAVTAHFKGADVEVAAESVFVEVEEGIACLTVAPSQGLAIFGYLHQMNYRIGYDLVKGQLTFLHTDCSKPQTETECG